MKDIFDTYVEHTFGSKEQARFKFNQFEFNYKKYFPKEKNKAHLLDIGIGRGEMLSCMKMWGYRNFLGIDISPSTIEFCQSLNLPCDLVDNSVEYLLNNPEKYDLITLLDVLEHIPKNDSLNFLLALRQALKPDGILIIQVPNLQAPDGYLHRYNDITHEVGFIEHSLSQLLHAAKFNKFNFFGFEEFVTRNFRTFVKKILRRLHWWWVRFLRKIDGNLNPKILNPVFYAVVIKN